MKNLITILILFVAFGCGKTEKPLSPEDSVVGSYEVELAEGTVKLVFLENGKFEVHLTGEAIQSDEGTWKITGKEVHGVFEAAVTTVFKIEPNGDLTEIAEILDGKRTKLPNEDQTTFKKIK